ETSTSITLGALVTSRQPMTSYMADIMMSAAGSVNIAASLGLLLIIAQITAIILVNVITKQKYAFIGLT
ncbi:iron ABC transporter permease, partial [Thermococci archaeon]